MLTDSSSFPRQRGVTLIELIVFIVVVSIALTVMVTAMNSSLIRSVDPVMDIRALECAQAMLDEINARKFDENSPTGGIPACVWDPGGVYVCGGIVPHNPGDEVSDKNDVGDFENYQGERHRCDISVSVTDAGADLGLADDRNARLITVEARTASGGKTVLSTYRTNF